MYSWLGWVPKISKEISHLTRHGGHTQPWLHLTPPPLTIFVHIGPCLKEKGKLTCLTFKGYIFLHFLKLDISPFIGWFNYLNTVFLEQDIVQFVEENTLWSLSPHLHISSQLCKARGRGIRDQSPPAPQDKHTVETDIVVHMGKILCASVQSYQWFIWSTDQQLQYFFLN